MMPNFQLHYNQGYAARPVNYDALYNEAFAQIGEARYIFCADSFADEFVKAVKADALHDVIAGDVAASRWKDRSCELTFDEGDETCIPKERLDIMIEKVARVKVGSELAIHEEIARMKLHIERPYIHALRRGGWEQQQDRAYQNLLQSALGFEPTDHSDAPPYIPTTPTAKPKPCVDFGFEPTEASE